MWKDVGGGGYRKRNNEYVDDIGRRVRERSMVSLKHELREQPRGREKHDLRGATHKTDAHFTHTHTRTKHCTHNTSIHTDYNRLIPNPSCRSR
jgi:hypothetical protein